ncbi:hypothetical protein BJ508DRAFT_381081 [Ascobolus immersus RN42]|uniref:Uncharacterized protein n=1 Tax=Ascobolus immersus RN42 TaxID=1160509 RepID=A0A3N4HHA5_ASCIM|nr:hypothetical protein BJ508DRAFT_381081 [Ascobolus immersus RN42]
MGPPGRSMAMSITHIPPSEPKMSHLYCSLAPMLPTKYLSLLSAGIPLSPNGSQPPSAPTSSPPQPSIPVPITPETVQHPTPNPSPDSEPSRWTPSDIRPPHTTAMAMTDDPIVIQPSSRPVSPRSQARPTTSATSDQSGTSDNIAISSRNRTLKRSGSRRGRIRSWWLILWMGSGNLERR